MPQDGPGNSTVGHCPDRLASGEPGKGSRSIRKEAKLELQFHTKGWWINDEQSLRLENQTDGETEAQGTKTKT